jgi:hypothetical protein
MIEPSWLEREQTADAIQVSVAELGKNFEQQPSDQIA